MAYKGTIKQDELIQIGNVSGYTQFDADGTITLVDDAVVWDDMQVNIGELSIVGLAAPAWELYKTGQVIGFTDNKIEEIRFHVQLPHKYKLGTDVEFHLHCVLPTVTTGNVQWEFEYTLANIGDTFNGVAGNATVVETYDTIDKHQLTEIMTIPGSTIDSVSSVLLCSLTRNGQAVEDTLTSDIYLIAVDFHIQIDSMGSREEYIK